MATAENIQTIMLCRFFAGLFAAAPLSNAAGAMADLWSDHDRALAVVGYSVAVIGGPTVGPLIGSAITNSYLGWRWTEYITAIMIFSILVLDLFLLPETYGVRVPFFHATGADTHKIPACPPATKSQTPS